MSFINIAPLGGYLTGSLIDESEINYWCGVLPDCIDGAGGGSYSLSAPLIIENDDVEIEFLVVTNSLDVAGPSVLNGLTASSLTVSGTTQIGDSSADLMTVTATAHFDNDVTLGVTDADTVTLKALLNYGATGRILGTFATLPDSNTSVNVLQVREVNTAATATRVVTTTGTATEDDHFTFYNGTTFSQTLTGVITSSVPSKTAAKYRYTSGAWAGFTALTIP